MAGAGAHWIDPSANPTTERICCWQRHFIVEVGLQQTVNELDGFLHHLGMDATP